jgi:hypothetical protein
MGFARLISEAEYCCSIGLQSLDSGIRGSGTESRSPVLADGKIYLTNEDGVTSVIKAGPVFALLAENDFDDYTLSSPAVSGGQIFFRTAKFLYAIGKRSS